jgi:hypothetical protein
MASVPAGARSPSSTRNFTACGLGGHRWAPKDSEDQTRNDLQGSSGGPTPSIVGPAHGHHRSTTGPRSEPDSAKILAIVTACGRRTERKTPRESMEGRTGREPAGEAGKEGDGAPIGLPRSPAGSAVGATERETPRESLGDARGVRNKPGNDLLSHARARAVPSALEGLTSEFEMGSGMAPPTSSPENFVKGSNRDLR